MACFDGNLVKLVSVYTKGAILEILQILAYESYKLRCYITSQKKKKFKHSFILYLIKVIFISF